MTLLPVTPVFKCYVVYSCDFVLAMAWYAFMLAPGARKFHCILQSEITRQPEV